MMTLLRRLASPLMLLARLFDLLFGTAVAVLRTLAPTDHAAAADAAADRVHAETERLLAAEPEPRPAPRHELATTAREYLAGADVGIEHLPPRQRFTLLWLKESRRDIDMVPDAALEAYVRGTHRAARLPDLWRREPFDRAFRAYLDACVDESEHGMAPAFGM